MTRHAVLTLALAGTLLACDTFQSPSNVVKTFALDVSNGNLDHAYSLLSEGARRQLDMFGGKSFLAEMRDQYQRKGGLRAIEILDEKITGEVAEVKYRITYGNGSREEDKDSLIRENGRWKLTMNK